MNNEYLKELKTLQQKSIKKKPQTTHNYQEIAINLFSKGWSSSKIRNFLLSLGYSISENDLETITMHNKPNNTLNKKGRAR